jgi:hypothetical protein
MPTFDGQTKTRTRVPLDKDAFQPNMGSLVHSANTEEAKIHGNRVHTIDGNFSERIKLNVSTEIGQNESHTVNGDRTKTVLGNHTETVVGRTMLTQVGPFMATYLSPKNDTHISPHNRVNSAPENQADPTSKVRILGTVFEHKTSDMSITDTGMELNGVKVEFAATNFEAKFLNCELKVIHLDAVAGIAVEPKITEVELKPLHTFLEGAQAKVAGGSAAVSPSINAVPHIPTAGGH